MNAREKLLEREKEIIRLLNVLLDKNLDFIVVGGYAIATYKKRFSVDLDLIIKEKDLDNFKKILTKEKYSFNYDKKIGLLYGEEFKRFSKKIKNLDVSVDLLINGLVSRTTNAAWSFDYIKKFSNERELDSLKFLTPERELLIAMKFHSGRLVDIRDVIALMPCNINKIKKHTIRGDIEKLKEGIKKQKSFLEKPQFDDSFKGIFGISSYDVNNVKETKELIDKLL